MGQAALLDKTSTAAPRTKPRLRGHSHALAALLALPAVVALVMHAQSGVATWAACVYGGAMIALFATSGTYHTLHWEPGPRAMWKRLDHAMIYALIAGTYTPVCLLALGPPQGPTLLMAVWTVAALGAAKTFLWPRAPRAINVTVYLLMGWMAAWVLPALMQGLGHDALLELGLGGAFYTVGALIYALRWPNPAPQVFGYHEIFHVFVIIAAALHFVVMWNVVA